VTINIFRPGEALYSSRVYNFLSPAPKADSLVDKVLKLFMAIILAPVSAFKYSTDLIKSFKEKKPKTTIEKFAFAANSVVSGIKKTIESSRNFAVKNQSTIIKVVIAAAAVTGAVYAYKSYNSEIQTQPIYPIDIDRQTHLDFTICLTLASVLGIVSGIVNANTAAQGPAQGPAQA